MPAQCRVAAAIAFAFAVVVTPPEAFWAFAVHAAAVLAVAVGAGVPLGRLARRLVPAAPFLAFAAVLPFVAGGPRTDVLGLDLSVAGLWGAWNVVAKATLGLAVSVVLVTTTGVPALLAGLERLRLPRLVVAVAGSMVRYGDVVAGDLARVRVARLARGDDPRWLWQARGVAAGAGTMFVRCYERGERVHLAMLARGWDHTSSYGAAEPARPVDWAVAAALPALGFAVAVVAR